MKAGIAETKKKISTKKEHNERIAIKKKQAPDRVVSNVTIKNPLLNRDLEARKKMAIN